jgi:hypothetical protein
MANEFNVSLNVSLTNGGLKDSIQESANFSQTAIGKYGGVVSIGTSEEDLPVGDVGTNGWVYLKNLDSTNYVKYGSEKCRGDGRAGPAQAERAGHVWFRVAPGVTIRAIADTAAVKVDYRLYEN